MRLIRTIVAALAVAAVIAPSAPASAQSGDAIFLRLAGIPGESQSDTHQDQIDVLSWSWGGQADVPAPGGGGGGAGKVVVEDLSLTKRTDRATPKILDALLTGKHLREAVLRVEKGGPTPQEYLKIKMTDVLITSYQTSQSAGDRPTESMSLNFAKIEWTYRQQNPDGSMAAPITSCWDVSANQTC